MPFKGGSSDKLGNRYEAYWTIYCIIDILNENTDLIYLEPPLSEGEGVEFYTVTNHKKQYYQVKRQAYSGKWTISTLKGVLKNFFKKLENPNATCYFVSSTSATELEGLIERARSSTSLDDFKSRLSKDYKEYWDKLNLLDLKLEEKTLFEYLKNQRITIEIISEESLKRILLDRLEITVEGDPTKTLDNLFRYVLDHVGSELTITSLWESLKKAGFHPTEWYKDHSVISSINNINERYLMRIDELEFSTNPILRDETEEILEKIKSKNDVIITGRAGIGKSGIISQLLKKFKDESTPFLIIDVENNNLTFSAKELGENMDLPSSPVNVLENIAKGEECVFVIDQLDSLSLIQCEKPGFLNCIYEIIKQAKAYPNMSLILVCRDFDLNNDKRLYKILNSYDIREIPIGLLSHKKLNIFLKNDLGVNPEELNSKQIEILRLPLHLKLFSELVLSGGSLTFNSENELYDQYWSEKKRYIQKKFKRDIAWDEIINSICKYVAEKKQLKVPKIVLDPYSADAEIMASEGILSSDSKYCWFFHGSFFDYAFARMFVSRSYSLLDFLLEEEQYLFKRSQVRQILSYKRSFGIDLFEEYIQDIKDLLNTPEIRYHIKILTLELFSNIEDPTQEELEIIKPILLNRDNQFHEESWRTIFQSRAWFEILDDDGILNDNLNGDDEHLIHKTMWLLYGVMDDERVSEFIKKFVGKSKQIDELIVSYVVFADFNFENNFKLLLFLIDDGIFERTKPRRGEDYWNDLEISVYKLVKTHPERSIEIISKYLDKKVKLSLAAGQKNPFSSNSGLSRGFEDKAFIDMAEKAPKEFLNKILPILLNLMGINAIKDSKKPFKDKIWKFRMYKETRYQNKDILLHSVEVALRNLISHDIESFKKWEDVLKKSDFETAHYLLVRSYSANGKIFADKAVDYLYNNPNSLRIGFYNAPYFASKVLIESISPYCSYEKSQMMEKLLLNFFTQEESYYKWVCTFFPSYGSDFRDYECDAAKNQLVLLEGIPKPSRLTNVRVRIKKLNETFNVHSQEPRLMETVTVTSPIPTKKVAKLTDDEWLDVIEKYDKERGFLEGGPFELSNELENLVKEDPIRFASLVLKFSDDTNVFYFEAVLRGIADSDADLTTVVSVCNRCHELPGKPCGRWITGPLANFAGEKLPDEALEILKYYVLNDPDPEEDLWMRKDATGTFYYGGRIFEHGLNSARGTAALSLASLIFGDEGLITEFYSTLNLMVQDPSISVRSCGAETLVGVLKHEPNFAFRLFKELCDTDDILLKTRQIERFLFYSLNINYNEVSEIIYRMIFSDLPVVAIVGSRLISYAYLNEKALLEFDFCLNYSEFHRLGIAQVFSKSLEVRSPNIVKNVLKPLFDDFSNEVRSEASRCFYKLNDDNVNEYIDLINCFIHSKAFKNNSRTLIHAINELKILPDFTLEVCNQFFNVSGSEASDIRTESAGTGDYVSDIILRLYTQTKDEKIKTSCLDIIDKMVEGNYLRIQTKLIECENEITL